jgi:hypothetical protein
VREQPTRHALLILQCPLIASRRAAIEQFKSDTYGRDNQDISVLNEAIEKAPIVSKEDALALIDFIREEAMAPEQHLIHSAAATLRKFIEASSL